MNHAGESCVALAAEEAQIVAEDVGCDALHGIRRALRWERPVVGGQRCEQFE